MDYTNIGSLDEMNAIIENDEAALFYFSAPQCNVCKVLKPKVAELIKANFPKVNLYYINIEDSPLISGQFRVFAIPTIMVYFDRKEYIRKSRNIGLRELDTELSRPYEMMFL
ncbi:MAG: thioredoxin family protein [Bacteroidales bacterium]|nr:thioredoxin family protein [Bacteroidales bacterium]MCF8391033.1 thioredoxin family protein [Bacteroidales bacterium]